MTGQSPFSKPFNIPKGTPIEKFWQWFSQNASSLTGYEQNSEAVIGTLHRHLAEIHPDLDFEMGRDSDGIYELIISPGGIRDMIPAVLETYKAAPAVEGWKFTAFKPRAAESVLQFKGYDYSADNVWYSSARDEDLTHVTLFMSGFSDSERDHFTAVGFMLLDMIVGEYDVMTQIGQIDIAALPENPEIQNLRPLSELAEEIDSNKSPAQLTQN